MQQYQTDLIVQAIVTIVPLLTILLKIVQTQVAIGKKHESLHGKVNDKIDSLTSSYEEAMISIIRDRISQAHHFVIKQGWIDIYELETLERLYTAYKNLGGNGFIHTLMSDIRELPTRKRGVNIES